jgi:hypothetical protein
MAVVYGFADDLTQAVNTLTGDNRWAFNQADSWKSMRASLLGRVSGANGALDFTGARHKPNEPLVVTTEADMLDNDFGDVGRRTRTLMDALWAEERTKLWLVTYDDKCAFVDSLTYYHPFRVRRSIMPGVPIPGGAAHTLTVDPQIGGSTVASCAYWIMDSKTNRMVYVSDYTALSAGGFGASYPERAYYVECVYYDATTKLYYEGSGEITLDADKTLTMTLAHQTDTVTRKAWWAWAKLNSAHAQVAAKSKSNKMLHMTAEFEVAEGVFYAFEPTTGALTEASTLTFNLTNNGNTPTHVRWVLKPAVGSDIVTSFSVENPTAGTYVGWADASGLAATKSLVVDSGLWLITNDGADAYSKKLSSGSETRLGWCVLLPGVNAITVAVTQDGADNWDLTYEFYDAYTL